MRMRHLKWGLIAGVAAGTLTVAAFTPSVAAPLTSGAAGLKAAAPNDVTDVHWRRRYRYGWGGAGFATGLALGALATRPYYYDPYYYYAPPPPVVYDAPPPGPYVDPNGPVRQCWVPTDRDRGYGYYRPC